MKTCFHTPILATSKLRFKKAPQNLDFVIAKAKSERYTVDCSCK